MGGNSIPLKQIRLKKIPRKTDSIILVTDAANNELLRYFSQNNDTARFIERCIGMPDELKEEELVPTRNSVLHNLYYHTRTQNEWMMIERGFNTRGQMLEESFWFRMAYHAFRELGNSGFTFSPAIDKRSGAFTVTCNNPDNIPVFRFSVPRKVVKNLLITFKKLLPNQNSMPIHPVPLKSIFNVTLNTELDLEVRPLIEVLQKNGESKFFKREDLERFRYHDLVYIPELGIMTELERAGKERKFQAPVKMVLKKSQVPEFLDKYGDELLNESNIISQEVKALKIIKEYEKVDITPEAIDRDWCWLSVKYSFGSNDLSLNDILRAARDGQRYIGTDKGWVDARSPELLKITDFFKDFDPGTGSDSLKLTRMDLIRLKTACKNLNITGDETENTHLVKKIFDLKPSRPVPLPKGLKSGLREYQKLGTEWLCFLFENSFGGLLCDDMGLGKTHQVMAFLLLLREQKKIKEPFLVVCPMTVLSHWETKIREHAPSLREIIYHGGDRNLEEALENGNLILTSYGILTRDIGKLKETRFSVCAFDEVQHIKNPETKAYKAARNIDADIKIGLTGTPIENRLEELKALFDLTVPGYLGTDADFSSRYIKPIQDHRNQDKQEELARLVSPFIIRRLKKSVLHELPEKIEDLLSCTLSDDQVKLYRDAIESRGAGLLASLKNKEEPVPYIHIFALLNLLKQVCNHPALVEKTPEKYEKYESGKWELFKEILDESIESDQKIVVYSQYLGMINIMERYLEKKGTGFVSLTGKSRNRGSIIKKFSDDPGCRVFIGSLKAGGVGIDLIAASVVIHYDRWWNAAKEDQATDRVHRIGQTRGVQVFKLVTEGTLEEKISAIISRKKDLMDSVIKEDDPGLLKSFSRDELIELINY
jgi:SNF2 family DNA or RNA helicase